MLRDSLREKETERVHDGRESEEKSSELMATIVHSVEHTSNWPLTGRAQGRLPARLGDSPEILFAIGQLSLYRARL